MRLPRFITRTMTLAVLNDVAESLHRIDSCSACPFARFDYCLHPAGNRIDLSGIEAVVNVHPKCPLRARPLLLQIRERDDMIPKGM